MTCSAEPVYKYPADEPVFSIAFPDDGEADEEQQQSLSVAPEGGLVFVELLSLPGSP
jgi:hypothetical protein